MNYMIAGVALILLGLFIIYLTLEFKRKKLLKLDDFRDNLSIQDEVQVYFKHQWINATVDTIVGRSVFLISQQVPEISRYRFDLTEIYPLNYKHTT